MLSSSVDAWKLGFSPLWKLLTLVTNRPETLLLRSSLMELAPKLDQGRFTPKSTKTNRTHILILKSERRKVVCYSLGGVHFPVSLLFRQKRSLWGGERSRHQLSSPFGKCRVGAGFQRLRDFLTTLCPPNPVTSVLFSFYLYRDSKNAFV